MERLTLVGVGASAGGLEPLQSIISYLPNNLQNAAIVVAQHLSPDYKSMLVELLSRKTKIPVKHAENGLQIEANTIYITPPNADIIIKDNTFFLKKPSDTGAHPSIDTLFTSIAKEYKAFSCGIILSGTGKDGTKGIIAIKKVGGITIVQDPATAKYEGMPVSAVNTKVADFILPPHIIGTKFIDIVTRKEEIENNIKDYSDDQATNAFKHILTLLEERIGIDFSDYKISTLTRRIQKRITEKKFDTDHEYLDYIRQNPEELDVLFQEMLIGVTSFFRDAQAFEKIEQVIKTIIHSKKDGESLRIWIPGCATGEEAYTFAMIVCEQMKEIKKHIQVQLFATDIDMHALQKAREGIYPAQRVQHIPRKLVKKYFTKINDKTYEIDKDLRKMVLFSRHDVTSNPPFLRLDVISCRNLLIYFSTNLQKKVLPLFYYALNPDGYMILGKSEHINQYQNLFRNIDVHLKIFQRKPSEGKTIHLPVFRPNLTKKMQTNETHTMNDDLTISEMVKETLYTNYEYPYVVIDETMDIVEINGDVTDFLRFNQGTASLNLMKLIHPQLQIETRSIVGKSIAQTKPISGNIRKFTTNKEKTKYVKISVKPLLYSKPNAHYFLIIFEEIPVDTTFLHTVNESRSDTETPQVIELEQELSAMKEHMNSLVEELETSNEELQALNEELQASNEELQASNEELETSNEELQATNEELENAYSELREANHQIEQQKNELQQSADNVHMLLNNTLVGFILIDRDYKVITYNVIAAHIYKKLFDSSLEDGASFIKVLPGHIFPAFHQNFKKALEGEQIVTEEAIQEKNGTIHYFDFNYTPVKIGKHEKEARMIAVSFVDITNRKKAEKQKDEFLSIASHELKTPITSVKGFNQILIKQLEKEDNKKMLLFSKRMDKQLNKLTTLINELLDISKIEAGKMEFNYEIVDIDALVREVVEEVQLTSFKHTIIIHGETREKIWADKNRSEQVLINLLSNAVKYSPDSNAVDIFLKIKDGSIAITVKDYGMGIDEEQKDRIFERFYQIDGEKQHLIPGLGLGLFISSEIIKRMGGTISVESKKGAGSQFTVSLPLYK